MRGDDEAPDAGSGAARSAGASSPPNQQPGDAGSGAGVAVVTGGTGFIGWHLCERLRDAGREVRAVVRPGSDNPLPDGVPRIDARLDAAEMAPACRGADVVFHLAGLTRAPSYETFLRVNAEGTRQAARAARDAGARLVYVSSQAAAGPGTPDRPRTEADPPEPVSDYGRSKLAGERLLPEIDGLEWTVIRPPAVYGPRDEDFLAVFRMARRGWFPALGPPSTGYTMAWVGDVVAALDRVADSEAAAGEVFFVGHPEVNLQDDLRDALQVALGRPVRALRVPRWLLRLVAEGGELAGRLGRTGLVNRSRYRELTAPGFVCSVDKIRRVTGFEAEVDLQRGFRLTADWYRRRGML